MGRSKPLLMAPGGQTFVARLIETLCLGGVESPLVVCRADDGPLQLEVESLGSRARWIVNPDADSGGQLSSLLVGLEKADRPGVRGVMMVPVDAPMITADTVRKLAEVFNSTGAPIVRPRYRGKNGHPVIFSRTVFDELRRADPTVGAKALLRAHKDSLIELDVDDAGVAGDIDTPEDYQNLLGRPEIPPS